MGLGLFELDTLTRAVQDVIGKIESILGIGAGRREADMIVPIQNDIHYNVLAPISKALETPQDITYQEAKSMYDLLVATEAKWLAFLHNTEWDDGRAATQAEATLEPYFSGFKARLQDIMRATEPWIDIFPTPDPGDVIPGYQPPYIPGTQPPVYTTGTNTAAISPTMLLIAAGAAFLLLMPSKRVRK